MGLGEAGISGEILVGHPLPSGKQWPGLDAFGQLEEYGGAPKASTGSCAFLRNYALYTVARKESTWLQLWAGLSYGRFSWPRTPT